MDSKVSVNLILQGCNTSNPCYALVTSIKNLACYNWRIKFSHCYREVNCVTDQLANHAHSKEVKVIKIKLYEMPTTCCREEFISNLRRLCLPRLCVV